MQKYHKNKITTKKAAKSYNQTLKQEKQKQLFYLQLVLLIRLHIPLTTSNNNSNLSIVYHITLLMASRRIKHE